MLLFRVCVFRTDYKHIAPAIENSNLVEWTGHSVSG